MGLIIDILKFLFKGKAISNSTKRHIKVAIKKAREALNNNDDHLKKASISQLDSMLGMALNDIYGKNTVAENLKKAKNRFRPNDYQKAWDAHKVRNRVVHEPSTNFSSRELDNAIRNFIKVLNKLKN